MRHMLVPWIVPSVLGLWSVAAHAGRTESLSIESVPAGATVLDVDGDELCTTPCTLQYDHWAFRRPLLLTDRSQRQPMVVGIGKPGYEPQVVELTIGPFHWSNVAKSVTFDYYQLQEHVKVKLARTPGAKESVDVKTGWGDIAWGLGPPNDAVLVSKEPGRSVEWYELPKEQEAAAEGHLTVGPVPVKRILYGFVDDDFAVARLEMDDDAVTTTLAALKLKYGEPEMLSGERYVWAGDIVLVDIQTTTGSGTLNYYNIREWGGLSQLGLEVVPSEHHDL